MPVTNIYEPYIGLSIFEMKKRSEIFVERTDRFLITVNKGKRKLFCYDTNLTSYNQNATSETNSFFSTQTKENIVVKQTLIDSC